MKHWFSNIAAQAKQAWKSSTIWFNTIGLAILSVAIADPLFLQTLTTFLSPEKVSLVILIVNIALRFKTSTDLASK